MICRGEFIRLFTVPGQALLSHMTTMDGGNAVRDMDDSGILPLTCIPTIHGSHIGTAPGQKKSDTIKYRFF